MARKGSGIKSVADLKGKRVSMDEPGSGTLVDVRLILGAYGMTDKDIKAEYLKPNQAGDKLKDGGLDAFFFVGGAPWRHRRAGLQRRGHRDRVAGRPRDRRAARQQEFFTPDTIAANTYQNVGEVKTISVNAQLVSSAKVPEAVVYEVTKALYSDATRKTLDNSHAGGQADHARQRDQGRGHSVPSGRREVLQNRPAEIGHPEAPVAPPLRGPLADRRSRIRCGAIGAPEACVGYAARLNRLAARIGPGAWRANAGSEAADQVASQ